MVKPSNIYRWWDLKVERNSNLVSRCVMCDIRHFYTNLMPTKDTFHQSSISPTGRMCFLIQSIAFLLLVVGDAEPRWIQ